MCPKLGHATLYFSFVLFGLELNCYLFYDLDDVSIPRKPFIAAVLDLWHDGPNTCNFETNFDFLNTVGLGHWALGWPPKNSVIAGK